METFTALLIDDEADFAATLAERLDLRGVEALVASDGFEGIELAKRHRPPVVLLDVMMPGIGGLEVLRELRRSLPRTEVILLTGRGLSEQGIEGMRQGAFDFMVKPVKIEELLEKMREAVAKHAGPTRSGEEGAGP